MLADAGLRLTPKHDAVDTRKRTRFKELSPADKAALTTRLPIPGTETVIDCDTLLLSVGPIPENELVRHTGIQIDPATGGAVVNTDMETSLRGVFACGNDVHVHDIVDSVTEESFRAGETAAKYILCRNAGEAQ